MSVPRPVAGTFRTDGVDCLVQWPSWSIMTRPPRQYRDGRVMSGAAVSTS
ncbi:hypothetical protein HMPREF9565_01367 [Cutibacterium acnes HL053PA2]|nr:hypothetical protein HMPREF9575_00950 [Cutibacterium acnes HL110PA1]EFT50738.1 hypothetical protein HMPREF9565_01367 [Cutibacterium acnes HL053PA2]EGF03473.1 hypothetical protein HMPREF9584_00009 [Cutibacterium acnes HL092PA1]